MGHNVSGKVTAATLLIALGIIYGDIGTSPLYVMKAILGERQITEELVLGGVSLVFWTLIFQTTIKYIWLTLQADNQGEGGIFSLYALVRKHSKLLVPFAILGATTLLADGIITPPISVASAVEGLAVIPHFHIEEHTVVLIVVIILAIIFFFQRFGTASVGKLFGPVMTIWFGMLLILGIMQITHDPTIIKALNPMYGVHLLTHYPQGFWLLSGVFLCTTGAEALYSDLGHCGLKNIRITWVFVKICLIINYLGQANWILNNAGAALQGRNPFFEMMPKEFLVMGVIIATCAAIIASQALITGSYTLINEAMNLNFWPRVAVRYPSNSKGQIYIPSINNLLWLGCTLMILYFQSSTHMEAAYGFSITVAMLMTTFLLFFYLRYVKNWGLLPVVAITILFLAIEISFFVANFPKIMHNPMGLVPVFLIFPTMAIWFYARKINNSYTKFVPLDDYTEIITELSKDETMPKFATHLVYLTKANETRQIEEKVIKSILDKKPKRADVYWFLHVNRTDEPNTLSYNVVELVDDKIIKLNINVGFRVPLRSELFFKQIIKELVANQELNLHVRPDGSTKYNCEPDMKFVVIEKFLSIENEFAIKEGLLLRAYFFLKQLGQSDQKAFGLEKTDIIVEETPFLYQPIQKLNMERLHLAEITEHSDD